MFAGGLLQISDCPCEQVCHQLLLLEGQGTSTAEVMEGTVEDLPSALRSTHLLLYGILEVISFNKKEKHQKFEIEILVPFFSIFFKISAFYSGSVIDCEIV